MAARKKKSPSRKDKAGHDRIKGQMAGPHVIQAMDRNITKLETLVDEAGKADRQKLDQIKIQMQGINHVLAAQRWKLNKIIPDAKAEQGEPVYDATLEDRMWAVAAYKMKVDEYLKRKHEGTLPPREPLPNEEGYEAFEAAQRRGDEKEASKYIKPHEDHRTVP